MTDEKPPKKMKLFRAYFCNFYSNDKVEILPKLFVSEQSATEALEELFEKKFPGGKMNGMRKDFGGYIEEIDTNLVYSPFEREETED